MFVCKYLLTADPAVVQIEKDVDKKQLESN